MCWFKNLEKVVFLWGFHSGNMERVQPVYFCFGAKPANSKFATKTAKKNCEYCHSSQWIYPKKLKRLKFFRNFKDGWRRRTSSKRVLLSWRSGNFFMEKLKQESQSAVYQSWQYDIFNSYSSSTRRIWADIYNQQGRRPNWLLSAHIRQVWEE